MARIKKFAPEQNLTSFQTLVVDENPNSDYFRITEFKDTFTGGKNGFLIEGSEYLKESTEIKIEILDVEGNPIYYEPGNGIPEYYEGISKLVAVYVYNDTPIGLGKITILGELKEYDDNGVKRTIPSEWQGAYNVKWERTFQVNKNIANEDKVRFYRRPQVSIDEIVKPIFSGNPPSVTQTGSLNGIPLVPTENSDLSNFTLPTSYRLKVNSGNKWTGSIEGQTISFDNINYSPKIDEVVNETEIVVSPPYSENNLVQSFTNEDYTLTFPYVEGVGDLATALTGSFAKINITDMKTFVGDAARVKVFRRSQSNLTDYEFVQEIQLESNEVLRDITTFSKKEESYGFFTQQVINDYWVTSSNDFTATFNQDFLYNSVKLDSTPTNYFFTSESFSVQNGVEYTLDFNVRKETTDPNAYLRVFLSGSYNNKGVTQEIVNIPSSTFVLQKTNFNENIVAENFDSSKLYFEVSGSDWYINNVSLKASQETSFSPDEITFIQQVPKTLVTETFDYRFEFYDINNNYIPVIVEDTKTFTGGNTNLFNKSIEITPDNLYFSFDSASNPANAVPPLVINFDVETNLVTGSITYTSGAFDFFGNEISASEYVGGQYPGYLTDWDVDSGRQPFLRVQDFTGSKDDITVQFIRYTAAVEGVSDTFIITRVEDGKGGVSFEIVPFRGTQIKNKESKTLEVQAVRVDGINRIDLQSGLDRGFSDAKLHLLSSSLDGTQTYVSLSQAITDTNFVEGISAGLTGSGEIDYNAIFTRDAIDNELTLYLMDGPTSESILTSLILTDLKDGLNPGLVQSTTEQFNIKYKPRELSPFNPQQSIVTASFQRRGTTLNPLSASLVIYPSSSIEPKTELPQFFMFYETGAFDDTIALNVTDGLGNSIGSGIPGDSVTYYSADETKQLNLEFTYTEPITSASVTANKSFFITPDGLPGQDSIDIDIDPQPVALGSNHKGEVYNYGLANTDIQLRQGDLFLINTSSGDPGTFTTRSIVPTNIEFTSLVGDSTTTMSLSGFESMSALSASIRYDFDIYPYFTSSLITASRTQKFTKVVEGAGAIEVTLDPIAVSFNADESGFISNYSAAETEIIVKQNDEYLVYDSSNSGTPGTFVTASISASNITFTELSSSNLDSDVSGDEILHFKGFGGMARTDVSASVVYNLIAYPYALKAGVAGVPVRVSKKQTFSKVNDGSAARKVTLSATSETVIYDGDGTKVAPSGDIILTATAFNNSGSAYFKFLNEEGGTIGASSTSNNLTLGDLPNAGTASTFTVELRDGTPNGLVLDTDTVTITGIQEGSTAYSVVLSNPASSVTVEVDGTKYFDNTGTLIRAYKGGTELQFVEEYDESALDPITFLPIGTFGQFSASIHEVSTFLTHSDGRVVETTGELFASSSGVSNWDNPQDNTQGFITYKIDFENGRGTQFVQQSFSTVFEGETGPGVVFRGPWTGSIEYIYNKDSKRRDAVLWSENGLEPYDTYYATKDSGSSYLVPSGSGNEPTIGGVLNELYWESLGQEEFFVAAKIAIFEESFVKNTINVGQPASSYDVNPQITIFGGDSEPYISVGQSIQGYGQEGVFIGVTEDGGPNGTSGTTGLLSIEDSTGQAYFRWDGYGLEVKSDDVIIETDNLTIDSQNEKISIGQGTQGFQEEGVYIGKDGSDYTLSLRGTPVGGEYNSLEWDGSVLTLRGAIRQTSAGVIEPSLRGTWTAGETYYPQDLVQYLGETWSSNTQHTATDDTNATTGRPGSGPWTIAAGAGKGVNLIADSYVIVYDEYGANPNPSGTMTLTANSSNFVNGYFKFTGGGAVFTDETTFTDGDGANTDTATFTIPTSYFSTPLQFRVGVAEGDQDEKVSDTITITAVQPGADSTPMYFITPIAGGTQIKNSSGTIELQVQKSDSTGLSDVTSGWPQIYDGASLISAGGGVSDGGNGVTYNPILNASAISGTKILSLKDSGGDVLDTITLVDVSDGLGGGSFISPNLKSTRNPADNSFLPTTLQATASFFDTSGTEYQAQVLITPSFSGGVDRMEVGTASGDTTEITITAGDGDGGTITLGGASVATKDVVLTAVFTDPATGQTTTINETFYIISDGLDGLDAITVINTNQAHTLPADSAGTVSSYVGSGTTLSVYEGTTQLDYDGTGTADGKWTVSVTPVNISAGSIGESGLDAVVGDHSSMTATQASASYSISGKRTNGESFTASTIQTFTKSVAGQNGTNGETGASVNIIFIRNATQPTTPSPSSGVPSGWSDSPPAGTDLLWASQGTKGVGDANFTWGTPYQVEGTAVAETTIYRLNSNAGNTGGSYNFTTSTLTPPTNWSSTVPTLASDGDLVYASNGLFSGAPTETNATTTWSTPVVYAQRTDGENGTNGVNAKTIRLSTSHQAFLVANDGSISPSTITLTANRQNISTATTFTPTPSVTLGGTGDTRTLSSTDFGANTAVTIEASADGLSDEITIVKVAEGTDAITIVLSNESHTFQADSAGNISDYGGSGTTITLYEGATQLDYDGSGTTAGHWTVSATPTNITTGTISDGGNFASVDEHENMTANQASISYSITGKKLNGDSFSFTKIQSFTKSLAGTSGTNGAPGADGDGAGVVYRGEYDSNKIYYHNANRRDVVKGSDGNYYLADNTGDNGTANWDDPVSPGADWTTFGAQFESVATDILFAQDVFAEYTLNVGASGSSAVIALNADAPNANANPYISIGQGASQGYENDGIFIGFDSSTPKLSLYADASDPNAGFIDFDGTNFTYSGLVTGSAVQGGELLIGFDTTSLEWQFRVNSSGEVTALGANNTFSGTITANNGILGGWAINQSGISDNSGSIVLSSEDKEISVSDSGGQQRFNANTSLDLPVTNGGSTVSVSLSGLGTISETLGKGNTTTGDSQSSTDYLVSPAMNITTAGKYKLKAPHVQNSNAFAEAVGAGSWATIVVKVELRSSSTGGGGTLYGQTSTITATSTGYDVGGIGDPISVIKGTQISLPNGKTKNVEDLKIGDNIIAWNVETSQYETAKLKNIKSRFVDTVYKVRVGDSIVEVSDSHGFFYAPGWQIKVKDLREGEDEVYVKEGDNFVKRVVDSIEILHKEIEVYSLSVPPLKNYISNNIVSHNFGEIFPESGGKNLLPSTTFTKTFDSLSTGNYYAHYVIDYTLNVSRADIDYWAEIGYSIFSTGAAYATLEPQTTGTFVNGGGFAVVNDDNDYFRVASSDTKQYGYAVGYATDLKGGLAIDALYGAGGTSGIGAVGGAYNVAGHPYIIKGSGIVTFTTSATGTHGSGTIRMSAGNFDSISGTTQGIYVINYTSELATGTPPQSKYATVVASANRSAGGGGIGHVAPLGVTTAITNNTTGAGTTTIYVGKPNASILENIQNLQFIIIQ